MLALDSCRVDYTLDRYASPSRACPGRSGMLTASRHVTPPAPGSALRVLYLPGQVRADPNIPSAPIRTVFRGSYVQTPLVAPRPLGGGLYWLRPIVSREPPVTPKRSRHNHQNRSPEFGHA